jgi:protease II
VQEKKLKKSTPFVHQDSNVLKGPVTRKIPVSISAHGRTWYDPYQWMSNLQDPALTRHFQDENSYTEAFMADTIELQQQLQAEMQSRMPLEVSTPPEHWGTWLYYQCIPEGKEYPVLCRRVERQPGLVASFHYYLRSCYREEVFLDWNEIAEQLGYVHVGMCRNSRISSEVYLMH